MQYKRIFPSKRYTRTIAFPAERDNEYTYDSHPQQNYPLIGMIFHNKSTKVFSIFVGWRDSDYLPSASP